MILINLAGGPGSGKSTTASHLFAELKMEQVKVELVGEEAKEIIYDKLYPLLDNQVLITGRQWQRVQRLNQSGCEVAISDSPLLQGILYIQDKPYCAELTALLKKLNEQIPQTYNVFVRRVKPYVQFGRYQNEAGARELDTKVLDLIKDWWMTIDGNRHGVHILTEAILRLVHANRLAEADVDDWGEDGGPSMRGKKSLEADMTEMANGTERCSKWLDIDTPGEQLLEQCLLPSNHEGQHKFEHVNQETK